MVGLLIRINDVNRLVVTDQAIVYEREQDTILSIVAIEKGTGVRCLIEQGPAKGIGTVALIVSPKEFEWSPPSRTRMHQFNPNVQLILWC